MRKGRGRKKRVKDWILQGGKKTAKPAQGFRTESWDHGKWDRKPWKVLNPRLICLIYLLFFKKIYFAFNDVFMCVSVCECG